MEKQQKSIGGQIDLKLKEKLDQAKSEGISEKYVISSGLESLFLNSESLIDELETFQKKLKRSSECFNIRASIDQTMYDRIETLRKEFFNEKKRVLFRRVVIIKAIELGLDGIKE